MNGKQGLPSDEWFHTFINRMFVKHEIDLSLRTPNVLSRLRAGAGSKENLSHYYQLLQQRVNDYHIDVSTSIDGTFVHFDLKSRKVIATTVYPIMLN